MKVISSHIQNQTFSPCYLLYGEETYLTHQYRDKLKEAIIGEDTMNYTYFEGDKTDIRQIIATGDTMPFFAERRLILIENSGFFKSATEGLAEYIKAIPEYLHIVFVEAEVDKRNKVYKAVADKGYVSEMKYQSDATLCKWIGGLLAKENKRMDRSAMQLFLTKTGTHMDNIRMELEKLICYDLNKEEITAVDVEQVCTNQTENKIFDMITAIAMKHQRQALQLYYDLLLLREPPMRILYLIVRQFNMMLQVKEMLEKRVDSATMARQLGIASFLVSKYIGQSKSFTSEQISAALEDFACMETDVKTGRMDDKMAVELMIVKYSNKNG